MQDKKQWILRDRSIRERLIVWLNGLDINLEKPLRVLVEPYKKNRSLAQNSLMWLWLNQMAKTLQVEHGVKADSEGLKQYFQEKWLGYKAVWIDEERMYKRVIGTSELNTAQFTEFLQQIEAYAASELGMTLPHPEDQYYEAMGIPFTRSA